MTDSRLDEREAGLRHQVEVRVQVGLPLIFGVIHGAEADASVSLGAPVPEVGEADRAFGRVEPGPRDHAHRQTRRQWCT